jgi:hypothetical protein
MKAMMELSGMKRIIFLTEQSARPVMENVELKLA